MSEDLKLEDLKKTLRRIANFWCEFIVHDAGKLDTIFAAVKHIQIVAMTGMKVWSMCEHFCMTMCGIQTPQCMIDFALSNHLHKLEQVYRVLEDFGQTN